MTMVRDPIAASWTVLIVDDELDNIGVAAKVLQFNGATVHTALNGEEGLRILESVTPTVVLLDISMPHMNGWAMLKSIREIPHLSKLPIIAVTAHAMRGDKEQIMEAGFDGYIAKPFFLSTFVAYIKEVLEAVSTQNKVQQHTGDHDGSI